VDVSSFLPDYLLIGHWKYLFTGASSFLLLKQKKDTNILKAFGESLFGN